VVLNPGLLFVSRDGLLSINVPEAGAAPIANAPVKPEDKLSVLLYYRSPLGDKAVSLMSSPNLAVVLARLGYVPDPLASDYDPKQPFIGLPYQKVVEVLSALCRSGAANATLVLQPAPVYEPSRTDLAEDGRPEGFVVSSATTAPATAPSTAPAVAH
jgi:hypothetical protein